MCNPNQRMVIDISNFLLVNLIVVSRNNFTLNTDENVQQLTTRYIERIVK